MSQGLTDQRAPQSDPAPASSSGLAQHVGRRLTQEEVAAISNAIGEPGIVPFLLRCVGLMACVAAALLLLGFGGRLGWRTPRSVEVAVALLFLCVASVNTIRTVLRRREP